MNEQTHEWMDSKELLWPHGTKLRKWISPKKEATEDLDQDTLKSLGLGGRGL